MKKFTEVPKEQWQKQKFIPKNLERVFRSDDFLVQVFDEVELNITRLSINRVTRLGKRWVVGITWDELQEIKRLLGLGDKCAVEIYPPEKDVVNVANMRHLWITEPPYFMWSKDKAINGE